MSVCFEAHDDPNIERVWTWFKFQQALVAESHASVRRIAGVSQPEFKQHESTLIGLTLEEVRARVKGKRKDSLFEGVPGNPQTPGQVPSCRGHLEYDAR